MPSKSQAQRRLMQAVAHNPEFAAKVDIPQSVGRDFVEADKKAGKRLPFGKFKGLRIGSKRYG